MINQLVIVRSILLRYLTFASLLFLLVFKYDNQIFNIISQRILNDTNILLFTGNIVHSFTVPFKLSVVITLLISSPYLLYEIWKFVKPALKHEEKYFFRNLLIMVQILMGIGLGFGYYVLAPTTFFILSGMNPQSVMLHINIESFYETYLWLVLASAIAFQAPPTIITLHKLGVFNLDQLKKARKFVIIISLIVGMLLTPPDVISQIILAIPMYILYELTLLWIAKKN